MQQIPKKSSTTMLVPQQMVPSTARLTFLAGRETETGCSEDIFGAGFKQGGHRWIEQVSDERYSGHCGRDDGRNRRKWR